MRLFLKRLAGYALFLLMIFFVVLQGLSWYNKKLVKQYKNEPDIHTLLIGDSHIQNSIDHSRLTGVLNLSQEAESLMFSYTKIKLMLESHPAVRSVLLGCSYNTLSDYYHPWITGENSYPVTRRYFFLLPFNKQLWLLWKNRDGGLDYLRDAVKTGVANITNASGENYSFSGFFNYMKSKQSVLDKGKVSARIKHVFYTGNKIRGFSSINISYLNKIITLCKERKVELIILNTPLSETYKELIPQQFKEKYYSELNNKVKLIDFSSLNLADSCYLKDGEHLAGNGAVITTDYLKSILQNK